jgi:hypothetical protein
MLIATSTTMKKVILAFPTYDSLWSFKEQANAINIRVEPKRNIISGLFQPKEVELAIQQYSANTLQQSKQSA